MPTQRLTSDYVSYYDTDDAEVILEQTADK